jgi:hypothetical protein
MVQPTEQTIDYQTGSEYPETIRQPTVAPVFVPTNHLDAHHEALVFSPV